MSYFVRVKICGVTCEEDAVAAADAGADAVGLNFAPESPRRIDVAAAGEILSALPPFLEAVGVFVNRPLEYIELFLEQLKRITLVQWHGQDHPRQGGLRHGFVPAFPVRDDAELETINGYLGQCWALGELPSALLLDGHAQGQHGGTGRTAPWELLRDFRPGVPVILAGGLNPDNVAEAIRTVRPYAVDVASGVESSPGRKDRDKVWRFIEAARSAAAGLAPPPAANTG